MTHICVSKQTTIGSDNGLSPGRRQAIIWTNAGVLLIGTLGTNVSEILIEIRIFSFKKMGSNVSSAKCRPFCLLSWILDSAEYDLGWGLLELRSLISPQAKFSILQIYLLGSLNHIHIRQVSPQPSCDDTCQISTCCSISSGCFDNADKLGI